MMVLVDTLVYQGPLVRLELLVQLDQKVLKEKQFTDLQENLGWMDQMVFLVNLVKEEFLEVLVSRGTLEEVVPSLDLQEKLEDGGTLDPQECQV